MTREPDQSVMHYAIGWNGVSVTYWHDSMLIKRDMKIVDPDAPDARFTMELFPLPDMIDGYAHYMLRLVDRRDFSNNADLVLMEPVDNDRVAEFARECRDYGMTIDLALVRDTTQKTPGLN